MFNNAKKNQVMAVRAEMEFLQMIASEGLVIPHALFMLGVDNFRGTSQQNQQN